MRLLLLSFVGFACLLLTSGPGVLAQDNLAQDHLAQEHQAEIAAATDAAQSWLALVDDEKYQDAWSASAALMRNAVPQTQLATAFRAAREPLGKLASRQLKDARYAERLPGAPDGRYVVIHFSTSFANKKAAIETITPALDLDGVWRVSGYYIK